MSTETQSTNSKENVTMKSLEVSVSQSEQLRFICLSQVSVHSRSGLLKRLKGRSWQKLMMMMMMTMCRGRTSPCRNSMLIALPNKQKRRRRRRRSVGYKPVADGNNYVQATRLIMIVLFFFFLFFFFLFFFFSSWVSSYEITNSFQRPSKCCKNAKFN